MPKREFSTGREGRRRPSDYKGVGEIWGRGSKVRVVNLWADVRCAGLGWAAAINEFKA